MFDSIENFDAFYDDAPDALYTVDLAWRILRVNRAFERLSGYTREETMGSSLLDLIASEHREKMLQDVSGPIEVDLMCRDGSRIAVQVTTGLILENGRPAGIHGFAREIAGCQRELRAAAEFAAHLRALHRLGAVLYREQEAVFSAYLAAGLEIFKLPHGAVWQSSAEGLQTRAALGPDGVLDTRAAKAVAAEKATIVHEGPPLYVAAPLFIGEQLFGCMTFWSKGGETLTPHARELIEVMAQAIGAALRHIRFEEPGSSASHDPLTKVANRTLLSRRLESVLAHARDRGAMAAILSIDLDRFKRVNHSFGRSVGDAFLQQAGARLQAHMRLGDTLARTGGDEFTAILPGAGEHAEVLAVAHRLLDALRAPCWIDGHEVTISASIGLSVYPRDGVDAGTLLRNAVAAMFSAERSGSDGVQLYSSEDTESAVARLSVVTSLRRALEGGEFRLFFEPQVDFEGRLAGAEVLLGWLHPERGRLPAREFIPIAEQTGMILPIGAWVLREACRLAAEWHTAGIRLITAVNVSALQFADAGFVDSVAAVLKETGLPPELLELELTESLLLGDMEQVAQSLQTLRGLGVRIAIDDFGTGYSSLRYIRHLPLDKVKIDRSFLSALENDPVSTGLLRAIVALGHTLGLTVTAEGVETRSQLRAVRSAGCDLVQGHLFGVALDASRMGTLLKKPQPQFAAEIAPRKKRP